MERGFCGAHNCYVTVAGSLYGMAAARIPLATPIIQDGEAGSVSCHGVSARRPFNDCVRKKIILSVNLIPNLVSLCTRKDGSAVTCSQDVTTVSTKDSTHCCLCIFHTRSRSDSRSGISDRKYVKS